MVFFFVLVWFFCVVLFGFFSLLTKVVGIQRMQWAHLRRDGYQTEQLVLVVEKELHGSSACKKAEGASKKILGNAYEPRTLDRSSDWIAAPRLCGGSQIEHSAGNVAGAIHEGPRKDIVP